MKKVIKLTELDLNKIVKKIINESYNPDKFKKDITELTEYIQSSGINIKPLPKVRLINQPQPGDDIEWDTGYYNSDGRIIVLYTYGRHEKDILRSYTHEMIHHSQNLTGQMRVDKMGEDGDPKYAQNDSHKRKLEEDAFKRGNMIFRDWTDKKKYNK